MESELLDQMAELINVRPDMVELYSVGGMDSDRKSTIIEAYHHPGTPLVWSFGEKRVVFYCKPGATVGIDIVTSDLDPAKYFQDPLLDDEDNFVVSIPICHFLQGTYGSEFNGESAWIDSITFIHRQLNDCFDGLAAIVFEFSNSIQFAISAVHESHFCYAFNNFCHQLLFEASNSPVHTLYTARRSGSNRIPVESVLWMVE